MSSSTRTSGTSGVSSRREAPSNAGTRAVTAQGSAQNDRDCRTLSIPPQSAPTGVHARHGSATEQSTLANWSPPAGAADGQFGQSAQPAAGTAVIAQHATFGPPGSVFEVQGGKCLETAAKRKGLQKAIAAELIGAFKGSQKALTGYTESAQAYAETVMAAMRNDTGNWREPITPAYLDDLRQKLDLLAGKNRDVLDSSAAKLNYRLSNPVAVIAPGSVSSAPADEMNARHEVATEAQLRRAEADPRTEVMKINATVASAFLVQAGIYTAEPDAIPATMFGREALRTVLNETLPNAELYSPRAVRMLQAIHNKPTLAPDVVTYVDDLIRTYRIEPTVDLTIGAWPVAAALLFQLHPDALARLVIPQATLAKLAFGAYGLIATLRDRSCKGGHPLYYKIAEGASAQERERILLRLAIEWNAIAGGRNIVRQFNSALRVLWHNAERMEALQEMDQQVEGGRPDFRNRSTLDLLNEFVPADYASMNDAYFFPDPDNNRMEVSDLDVSWEEDRRRDREMAQYLPPPPEVETKRAGTSEMPRAQTQTQVPTEPPPVAGLPQPLAARTTQPIQPQPVDSSAETAHQPLSIHTGSKPRGQPEHWHKREHKGLAKRILKQRLDMIEAEQLGLQVPRKWEPWVSERLAERSVQARRERTGVENLAAGGSLVSLGDLVGESKLPKPGSAR